MQRLVASRARIAKFVAACAMAALFAAASTAALTPPASAAGPPALPPAAWSKAIGPTHLSSPVVADVNGDGMPDVLTTDLAGWLHVRDGSTGDDLPGWPQLVQPRAGVTTAVESSPTVADLDRNGKKEIIVGAGSLNAADTTTGGVIAFNANGSVRWRKPSEWSPPLPQGGVPGTPAVGDVNGDGFPDVVYGSWDHRLYVVDRFGRNLPGFPMDTLDTIWDSPALYDEAHIGRMDIFLGGDASPGGPCGRWSWAGVLRAIRVTSSGPRVLWQRCQHQIFQSSPAIGDLEGNGHMALVIGTGAGPSGDASATNAVSAFHLDSGTPVPGWPVHLNGAVFGSPVIGDVDGDGHNDVVVTACAICTDGRVWALRGNGTVLWSVVPGAAMNDYTEILSTPILADLDGNGVNDVAVGQAGAMWFLRGSDGGWVYQPVEVNRVMQNSAAVANFGTSVGWRLIVQSWQLGGNGTPEQGSGRVDSFPLPIPPTTAPAWPQWRDGPTHVGGPLAPPPPPAHSGYWLSASDGGIFAYGNAHFYGSTGAIRLNKPIVGMTPTPTGRGYWLVAADGGIFAFGDAHFYGSTGARRLNRPIVAMSPTASGHGYWLVASDGGIFAFGDARFFGSTGRLRLKRPMVGMTSTSTGRGYWLVASDGGIFAFGDARFFGSTGALRLARPIIGMARTSSGRGYWLAASDGGMFAFGDAHFYGSTGGLPIPAPVIGMARTPTGSGYWLAGRDGAIYAFGDARTYGAADGIALTRPIMTVASSPAS